MSAGFHIVEPPSLDHLMKDPIHHDLATMVLSFVARAIEARHPQLRVSVRFVEYLGAYPALAVQYPDDCDPDNYDIEDLAERIANESLAMDLLRFAWKNPVDWREQSTAVRRDSFASD